MYKHSQTKKEEHEFYYKDASKKMKRFFIFLGPAEEYEFSFRCVALLYVPHFMAAEITGSITIRNIKRKTD